MTKYKHYGSPNGDIPETCQFEWDIAMAASPIFGGIGPQGIYYIVLAAARAAGIADVKPHDLRRSAARLSFQGGASMAQIQQSLGHSSVQTTERYINAMQEIRPGKAAFDMIQFDEEETPE